MAVEPGLEASGECIIRAGPGEVDVSQAMVRSSQGCRREMMQMSTRQLRYKKTQE